MIEFPTEEPLRKVERTEAWPRPRSGIVLVIWLECGHRLWRCQRAEPRRPPRPVRCTACYLDAIYRARTP